MGGLGGVNVLTWMRVEVVEHAAGGDDFGEQRAGVPGKEVTAATRLGEVGREDDKERNVAGGGDNYF
jgi:hypothetical protein